nr:hypothetical protein BaRGS_000722 [Batillaria attramentaria]
MVDFATRGTLCDTRCTQNELYVETTSETSRQLTMLMTVVMHGSINVASSCIRNTRHFRRPLLYNRHFGIIRSHFGIIRSHFGIIRSHRSPPFDDKIPGTTSFDDKIPGTTSFDKIPGTTSFDNKIHN